MKKEIKNIKTSENTKSDVLKKSYDWVKRNKWFIIAGHILMIIIIASFSGGKKSGPVFSSIPIVRGDLTQMVTATGQIRPLNTIKVGSQVSGTIEELLVDYNSTVKKGDVLLKIDPTVLKAAAAESKASLVSAESTRNLAKNENNRNKLLFADGFIARAELEKSESNFETAEQSVKRAKSGYDRAMTNLSYATIESPVDGTVISRKVDKGQTVTASFQTPDLFEIAEDLSKMQIETSVSEADIGMVKQNQTVSFTVDAYPKQTFTGTVRQIRLSPTTTSNVVVYTVVIDLDNSDMKLMPGMTAFVTIVVASEKDVWKTSNAAFFMKTFENITDAKNGETPKTHLAILRGDEEKPNVILVPYTKGLITPTDTEIIGAGILAGDKIITGRLGLKPKNKTQMGPPKQSRLGE